MSQQPGPRAFAPPGHVRVRMVALAAIPLIHAAAIAAVFLSASGASFWRGLALAAATLYLVPPLIVRGVISWRPLPTGRIDPADTGFLIWWFTAQWQVLFVRLPFLEELLRLVPGLYSMWLRLWGARVGSLVYWAPGVVILDRPLVRVGNGVVFGMGARLDPHAIAPLHDGRVGLIIAPVTIGDYALVGGYSILLPGATVRAGALTKPFRPVRGEGDREGE